MVLNRVNPPSIRCPVGSGFALDGFAQNRNSPPSLEPRGASPLSTKEPTMKPLRSLLTLLACAAVAGTASAASSTAGMKEGKVELKSAGPITFGPEGVLLIGDSKSAAIFAVATGDTTAASGSPQLKVEAINVKLGALLGTAADQLTIDDLAVNPISRNAYLAVTRGRGADATPVLVRVNSKGTLDAVSLDKVKFSKAELPNPPAEAAPGGKKGNPRLEAITDIAYLDGSVLVAGLSNEEFASTLRSIPFPFQSVDKGTAVEIYHGAHGAFETRSPVRTFVPFKVGNEASLFAAYTCTPLVQFPIKQLQAGAKIRGKTIAELGNRNRPLDMIVYKKDGKDWLLLANNNRGVMKITTDSIEKAESITARVADKQGTSYETISAWTGIEQLDKLGNEHALVIRREGSTQNLETLPLP